MIVLYIFIGIITFILLLFGIMLFIPLKIFIKGTYWDKLPTGQMETYWIKYIFGVRLRIKDIQYLHILIWFFGIPIPLRISLKKLKTTQDEKESITKEHLEHEKPEDPVKIDPERPKEEKKLGEKFNDILDANDKIKGLWNKYRTYIKKIFVSYITFSIDHINTEIGFEDPSQTGIAAGIVYSALSIKPLDNLSVSWDYAKPNFNISSGIKMTMNLYGILRTLLSLYLRYKKDRKNEVQ